jgi:hypothetical protein
MRFRNPLPKSPKDWLVEISKAYLDAQETIPFGRLIDHIMTDKDLFHLAPVLCLKFRGIPRSKKRLDKITEAALSSYIATEENVGEVFEIPQLSFAFCYLASHFALDILDENQVSALMDYMEKEYKHLVRLTR